MKKNESIILSATCTKNSYPVEMRLSISNDGEFYRISWMDRLTSEGIHHMNKSLGAKDENKITRLCESFLMLIEAHNEIGLCKFNPLTGYGAGGVNGSFSYMQKEYAELFFNLMKSLLQNHLDIAGQAEINAGSEVML